MTMARRARWSLQPLPMAVLVVALMVTIAASIGRYARQRQAALTWIEQTRGSVEFGTLPRWLPEKVCESWPRWAQILSDDDLPPQ